MKHFLITITIFCLFFLPSSSALAATEFNPHFIISDEELQDCNGWTARDVQEFLDSKGSYLRNYQCEDVSGTIKTAAEIIYDAAVRNQISPKFLLVTLQKEQSLITDDSPTARQLDWATGFAVCDGCALADPKVQKYKGFGKQVDGAAGIMRWYYDNTDKSFVKKKDSPIYIDAQPVTPQTWATAFLYTYTPHLHGNQNFWRIWSGWFAQFYPNGTIVRAASSSDYYMIQDGKKRKFASKTILVSRADPQTAVTIPDIDLQNYPDGTGIAFANYSILRGPNATYLLDYDTLRPFASSEVVRQLGYNPQEIVEVNYADIAGYAVGPVINASTTAPQGVIYKISDLNNTYYLLKDNLLYPLADKAVAKTNFPNLAIETHGKKDLALFSMADRPIQFTDGSLVQIKDSSKIFVIDRGKKRRIADADTFNAMGYQKSNLATIELTTAMSIPDGEPIYVNNSLASAGNKFLGDSEAPVDDVCKAKLPSYLVAEYPSGKIISGKNIDTKRSIASLTKLLVAYEALSQDYNLTKTSVYNSKLHASSGNPLSLVTGEKLKNKDILYSALVSSVNNAARMVATGVGLSEKNFIASINTRLDEWGADNTTITDTTGLDAKNISTARDVLKIFTKVLKNATIKDALGDVNYTFKEVVSKNKVATHTIKNTNQLMMNSTKPYRILASKTGYTDEADAVLAMLIESKKDKKQYIVITLGNTNYAKRFDEPNRIATMTAAGQVTIAGIK
ncbi:MAG: serine hydrolase [Patescibacteria group bacterium]|nr:serine hydrolase [Patescibacteria group bacterium]